jgi:hypothetical protein
VAASLPFTVDSNADDTFSSGPPTTRAGQGEPGLVRPITVSPSWPRPNAALAMTAAVGLSQRVLQDAFVILSVDEQTLPMTDTDGDGLPDEVDACPASDLRPTVMIDDCDAGVPNLFFEDGCTLADLVQEALASGGTTALAALLDELAAEGSLSIGDVAASFDQMVRAISCPVDEEEGVPEDFFEEPDDSPELVFEIADPETCDHGESRGTLSARLGKSKQGHDFSAFRLDYLAPQIPQELRQCCTQIGYIQIVSENQGPWEIDWEASHGANGGTAGQPHPYYPYQTFWVPGRGGAVLSDDPGSAASFWGEQEYQDFETCAICIDTVKHAPPDLKKAVIACVTWGHWIQNPWRGGPTHGGRYIEGQTPTALPPNDTVAWQGAEPPTQTFLEVTKGHVSGDFLDRLRIIASNRRK